MGRLPIGIGPGYIKLGPWSAGPFGIGCLLPFVLMLAVGGVAIRRVVR
jgi:hypothetical protein